MRKIKPTFGFCKMFINVSALRLPNLSGIAIVFLSNTFTNPDGSPFGEISKFPFKSDDAIAMNGDWSINIRQFSSMKSMVFRVTNSLVSIF
jgi:hypothetical protein